MFNNPFNTFFIGFVIFNIIASVCSTLSSANEYIIGFVKIIGWYYILKGYFAISRNSLNYFSPYYKFLLILYAVVCVIMIVRGYTIDYQYQWISTMGMINYHFFASFYILCYLMPLVMCVDYRFYDYGFMMNLALKSAKISVVLFIFALPFLIKKSAEGLSSIGQIVEDESSQSTWILPYTIYTLFIFFVLLGKYQTKKEWLWHLGGWLSVLLGLVLLARRGDSFITVLYILFPIYMWVKNCKNGRIIACIIMVLFVGLCAFLFVRSSFFSFIEARGLEDNRSGVDEALMNQMNDWEVVFGKGLNGRYYYPLHVDDYLNGWRYGSETGFYNLVLKGGFLMAFVYIALLLIPSLKGMFKSNNVLCKASGYYIFVSLLELYPFGWLMFNLKFLLIWMGIVICMNPYIRYMNDEQIYEAFFLRRNV